jgi:hypothetical protein
MFEKGLECRIAPVIQERRLGGRDGLKPVIPKVESVAKLVKLFNRSDRIA